MFNRSPRTLLPAITNAISDEQPTKCVFSELKPGDTVRIHDGKSWSRKGIVTSKAVQPRSYHIKMSNNRTLRRNRQHILKTKETNESDFSDSDGSLIDDNNSNTNEHNDQDNTEYDSDETIPFGKEDEQPIECSHSGRTLRPPAHLKDFIR